VSSRIALRHSRTRDIPDPPPNRIYEPEFAIFSAPDFFSQKPLTLKAPWHRDPNPGAEEPEAVPANDSSACPPRISGFRFGRWVTLPENWRVGTRTTNRTVRCGGRLVFRQLIETARGDVDR
jgi:hypothetical protein